MTTKERLFVVYYLGKAKGNGTEAARQAGYNHPRQLAVRLLSKANIREAIDAKLDKIEMSQEEVLARLSDRAASSGGDFLTFHSPGNPNALPSLDLTRARRLGKLGNLKKMKANRSGGDDPMEVIEVEIHDALPALALLAKFHGLLVDRVAVTTDEAPRRIEIPDEDDRQGEDDPG